MRKRLVFLILLVQLVGINNVASQVAADFASIVNPPSDAAALTKNITQVDVSHYNGTVNFSIPLYVLKGKDLSYPISLNYSPGSGIDQEQRPSSVGEGWELDATSAVSRMIRGYTDFKPRNFSTIDTFFGCVSNKKLVYAVDGTTGGTPVTTYWNDPTPYHNDWAPYDVVYPQNDVYDTEHDIFYYNVPGGPQGSFMIQSINGGHCASDPNIAFYNEKNISVYHHPICQDDDYWQFYDLKGNKYVFAGTGGANRLIEWVQSYSLSNSHSYYVADDVLEQASKWFLEYIESPSGERIEFEYDDDSIEEQVVPPAHRTGLAHEASSNVSTDFLSSSPRTVTTKTLKKIKLVRENGDFIQVEFNYSLNSWPRNRKQVDQIVVSHHNSTGSLLETLDEINFDYLVGTNRHFLKGLDNLDQTLKHDFEYYSPGSLQDRSTGTLDYWGFYHGKLNSTKLPSQEESLIINRGDVSFTPPAGTGADRKPGLSVSHRGLVSKITNPYGGEVEIAYEPNRWDNAQSPKDRYNYFTFDEFSETATTTSYSLETEVCSQGSGSATICASIPAQSTFYIEYSRTMELRYEIESGQIPSDFKIYLEDAQGNQLPGLIWYAQSPNQTLEATVNFSLSGGSYTLVAEGDGSNWHVKGEIYSVFNETVTKTGGAGSRVKEIKLISNSGQVTKKTYKYYGGVLNKVPWNGSFTAGFDFSNLGFWRIVYSSLFSYTDPGLGVVGYSKVEEYLGTESSTQGMRAFEFYNDPIGAFVLFGSVIERSTLSGLRLPYYFPYESKRFNGKKRNVAEMRYDVATSQYVPLQSTSYVYTMHNEEEFHGSHIKNLVNSGTGQAPYEFASYEDAHDLFQTAIYREKVGVIRNDTITNVTYDLNGHSFVSTMVFNSYEGDYALPTDVDTFYPEKSKKELYDYGGSNAFLLAQYEVLEDDKLVEGESYTYHSGSNKVRILKVAELTEPVSRSGSTMSIYAQPKIETKLSGPDIVEVEEVPGRFSAYVFNSRDNYPIAQAQNAKDGQVYFTSFELTGTNFSDAKTGSKVHNSGSLNVGNLFSPPSDGEVYLMSYWYWDGSDWIFSGRVPYASSISSGSKIDNLRVFPQGAKVTTSTYDLSSNMTSQTGVDDVTTYYEYDGAGRPIKVLDQYKNIVRTYTYHLFNQD